LDVEGDDDDAGVEGVKGGRSEVDAIDSRD